MDTVEPVNVNTWKKDTCIVQPLVIYGVPNYFRVCLSMYVCTYAHVYVCTRYVCIYVCICMYMHI